MDIEDLRRIDIRLHGLDRADAPYTIYYDETNNIRRLHVTADGLNVDKPGCFVLAGVAHRGARRAIDLDPLRAALKLQPTTKEMKLAHIGKGDFLDLLRSQRLGILLDWIAANDLFLHYQSLDVIYWSSLCENAADVAAGRRCPVDSGQILAQYPSGCDGFEDCLATPDIEDPGQVVGQYMQRHFG